MGQTAKVKVGKGVVNQHDELKNLPVQASHAPSKAIESMKIGSGTVAPVAASNSGRCPTAARPEI